MATMDSRAVVALGATSDTPSRMTSSSAPFGQSTSTPSSSLLACFETISSAQMVQPSTLGVEASTLSGTSLALILWPRRILTVHQRRQGQQHQWQRRKSGRSTAS